jgi:hypothetical protein
MIVEIGRQNIIILFLNNEAKAAAVSFSGIHKSEPDIHLEFSPALHLQRILMSFNENCFLRAVRTKERSL